MAIWQFECNLIPQAALVSRFGNVPTQLSADVADDEAWWAEQQPPDGYRSVIESFSSGAESWSDSILMWGHYTSSHEGFVIGFDAGHSFFNQRRSPADEFGFLRQVRYQVSRPAVSLMSSGALEWFETKADVWAYEREWRMFLVLSQAKEVIPIGETLVHLFEFPSDCITEVILGVRCSSATETAIISAIASFQNAPAIYRCGIDDGDYRITRRKV
jgi:hypothetical protein